jgi:tetratricopeptide (TPR) repeat protein
MANYYVGLAEWAEPLLRTGEQLSAIDVYEAESANLTGALRTAIEMSDVDTSVRLLNGMFWYFTILGQGERAEELIDAVLGFGDRLPPDVNAAYRAISRLFRQVPSRFPMDGVREVIDECVRTGAVGKYPGLSVALPMLAFLGGDRELAMREVHRAQADDDTWIRSGGYWVESFLLDDTGDVEGADRARDLAHAGFLEVGDRWGTAMTLSFKANALSQAGKGESAIDVYQQGLALSMELRSPEDVVQHWWRLAIERARLGDLEGAWRDQEAAERYGRGFENPQQRAILMFGRIELCLRSGRVADARAQLTQLRSLTWEAAFPEGMGEEWVSAFEGRLALAEHRPDAAEAHLTKAIFATRDRGDMPDLAGAVELLALVRDQQGRPEEAARTLGASALIRGRFDLGSPEVRELIAHLRAELSDARYEELIAAVRAMSKEDAIAELYAAIG